MRKRFNVTGSCNPEWHYMVDTEKRFKAVEDLIDMGEYFTINRARQYGKTTMWIRAATTSCSSISWVCFATSTCNVVWRD